RSLPADARGEDADLRPRSGFGVLRPLCRGRYSVGPQKGRRPLFGHDGVDRRERPLPEAPRGKRGQERVIVASHCSKMLYFRLKNQSLAPSPQPASWRPHGRVFGYVEQLPMDRPIPRRTVLKGLGAAVALPWLEAMTPIASAAPAARSPLRAAFLYVPNGMHMQDWTPKEVGALEEFPETLEPLKAFKNDLNVFSGLTLDKARANGDGPGDHARAQAAFLTGRQPRKTHGADIRAGQSAD